MNDCFAVDELPGEGCAMDESNRNKKYASSDKRDARHDGAIDSHKR